MVRLISRQRGGLAALKLTKLFGIDDFPPAKDSGKVLIIIIYCYLINIIISIGVQSWTKVLGQIYICGVFSHVPNEQPGANSSTYVHVGHVYTLFL